MGRIRDLFSKPLDLAPQFPDLTVKDTRLIVAAGQHRAEQLTEMGTKESVQLIRSILGLAVVREAEIQIEINHPKLRGELPGNDTGATCDHDTIKLSAPLLRGGRGSEVRLVLENGEPSELNPFHRSPKPSPGPGIGQTRSSAASLSRWKIWPSQRA